MQRRTPKPLALPTATLVEEDRYVGRAEAARIIGMSESSLRRRERTNLPAVVENGVHRHSVRKLLEYKVEHLSVKPEEPGFDGTIAAAAFEQFDQGLGPADVVRALRVDPRLARDLHHEWADLRGAVVICGKAMVALQEIWWLRDEDDECLVRNGDDLVKVLQEHKTHTCIGCRGRAFRSALGASFIASPAPSTRRGRPSRRQSRPLARPSGDGWSARPPHGRGERQLDGIRRRAATETRRAETSSSLALPAHGRNR